MEQIGAGRGAIDRGPHAVAVVLDHVDDRQLPQRGHVEAFVDLALIDRAVAEIGHRDQAVVAVMVGEGEAGADRHLRADDAVAAEEILLPAEHVHRAALAVRIAAAAPGQLGHDTLGIHAAGQHVAVVAIGGDDRVAFLAAPPACRRRPPPDRYRGGRSRRSAPCRTSARPAPRSGGSAACRGNSRAAPSVATPSSANLTGSALRLTAMSLPPGSRRRAAPKSVPEDGGKSSLCNLDRANRRKHDSRTSGRAGNSASNARGGGLHDDDLVGRDQVQGRADPLVEQVGIEMVGPQVRRPSVQRLRALGRLPDWRSRRGSRGSGAARPINPRRPRRGGRRNSRSRRCRGPGRQ